jgi:hypothetical protein
MNDEVTPPKKPRITWLQVLVGVTALLLLTSLLVPTRSRFAARGNITKGISNARQIVMALKLYASDHDGKYPDAALADPKNANEVFRILFKEETIESEAAEAVFGCPVSPFVPDGKIGSSKDRSKALDAGENHWAIMRGLEDYMSGNIPLVFENPAKATWPPMWNPDAKGTPTRGRAWSTGIIMGMNDGGAQIMPLDAKLGTAVPLKKIEDGKDWLELTMSPPAPGEGRILDVEVAPAR